MPVKKLWPDNITWLISAAEVTNEQLQQAHAQMKADVSQARDNGFPAEDVKLAKWYKLRLKDRLRDRKLKTISIKPAKRKKLRFVA